MDWQLLKIFTMGLLHPADFLDHSRKETPFGWYDLIVAARLITMFYLLGMYLAEISTHC